MSSVAEALLGGGGGSSGASKRLNPLLLPPPPKLKKPPKTFIFELELEESNELSYPEYSWTELVKTKNDEDFSKKIQMGAPTLNPYASDDEDDLKAIAAKFEAKYAEGPPSKKKKHRVEDYIDKGAGYDESDPFIDNSDIYDEIVPPDLQTVHGGFYINSGSLDFKEVELSEDDSDSQISPVKKVKVKKKVLQAPSGSTPILTQKVKKAKTKIGSGIGGGLKNPVGRPPGIPGIKKRPSLTIGGLGRSSLDKNGGATGTTILKKRKLFTPAIIGADGKFIKSRKSSGAPFNLHSKPKPPSKLNPPSSSQAPEKGSKAVVSLTSSSEGSSSSSEGSSSSTSGDDSSTEEAPAKDPKVPAKSHPLQTQLPKKLKPIPLQVPSKTPPASLPPPPPPIHQSQSQSAPPPPNTPQPPKRVKVKNVPLNPKLHPSTSITPLPSSNPPPPPLSSKVQQQIIKDLNKLAAAQAANGLHLSSSTPPSNSTPLQKISPPKPILTPPTTSSSSNLTLASLIQSAPPTKPRKPKQQLNPSNPPTSIPSHMDIFTSLSSPYTSHLNISNFTTSAILKSAGYSVITSPSGPQVIPTPSQSSSKAMPHLKKMSSSTPSPSPHLISKTLKPKPIKRLQKPPLPLSLPSPPIPSTTSSFTPVSSSPYLSYKNPPPPLQGPGVEISKVPPRPSPSLPKSSPPPSHFPIATSSSSPYFSSPSPLSVPSSLTVQRLPHSITITPSSTSSYVGGTVTSTPSPKPPTKNSTSFDMSSLLNNPMINFQPTFTPKPSKAPLPPSTSISNTKK